MNDDAISKISRLEVELAALKRGKSEEEIELEQEKKEKVKQKIVSLTASLDKMKGQAHALQKEIKKLEDAASSKVNADELKKKKEALSMATAKEGAVLESIEVELKEKLALAKVKMEDCSAEFNRTRHELQAAKETVTSIQSEVIECQRKLKEVGNICSRLFSTEIPHSYSCAIQSFPRRQRSHPRKKRLWVKLKWIAHLLLLRLRHQPKRGPSKRRPLRLKEKRLRRNERLPTLV